MGKKLFVKNITKTEKPIKNEKEPKKIIKCAKLNSF